MTMQELINEVKKQEVQTAMQGNGVETTVQRLYIEDKEYTLVSGKLLYMGVAYYDGEKDTYSTVTRIKEGRREDRLLINGYAAKFAGLIANNITEDSYFNCCGIDEF